MLLANGGGPSLAGIIIGTSPNATDIDANVADWRKMVAAARANGPSKAMDDFDRQR